MLLLLVGLEADVPFSRGQANLLLVSSILCPERTAMYFKHTLATAHIFPSKGQKQATSDPWPGWVVAIRPLSSLLALYTRAPANVPSSYSPAQMYELISDVPKYAGYIPFCTESTVLDKQGRPDMNWRVPHREPFAVNAELAVGFGGLEERYISQVVGTPFESVSVSTRSSGGWCEGSGGRGRERKGRAGKDTRHRTSVVGFHRGWQTPSACYTASYAARWPKSHAR